MHDTGHVAVTKRIPLKNSDITATELLNLGRIQTDCIIIKQA
jgi:hypothetical protein